MSSITSVATLTSGYPLANPISEGEHPEWESEATTICGREELARIEAHHESLRLGTKRALVLHARAALGKSTIAEALWHRLCGNSGPTPFDVVVWLSLKGRNARYQAKTIPLRISKELPQDDALHELADLYKLVASRRVLFVLDNLEAVMTANGGFVSGFEDYGALVDQLCGPGLRGATIITTRVLPRKLRLDRRNYVELEDLREGLSLEACLELVARQLGLTEPKALPKRTAWEKVIKAIERSPLVVRLIASDIEQSYKGAPGQWLEDPLKCTDLASLLEKTWVNLSPQEREVLLWLAINREPLTPTQLESDLVRGPGRKDPEKILECLSDKIPIATHHHSRANERSLHDSILQFCTSKLIEEAPQQLLAEDFVERAKKDTKFAGCSGIFLIDHALVKASAPERIQKLQRELILRPILESLRDMRPRRLFAERLEQAGQYAWPGYLASNLIALLRELAGDKGSLQISAAGANVRQADLRRITSRHRIDLDDADLRQVAFLQPLGEIRAIARSPDHHEIIAVGDSSGTITVWNIRDMMRPRWSHAPNKGTIRAMAVSRDGRLAAAGDDDRIVIWDDWHKKGSVGSRPGHHAKRIRALAFDAAGRLASASEDGTVLLHDLKGGTTTTLLSLDEHNEGPIRKVNTIAFHPHDGRLVAGTYAGNIYVVDMDDRKPRTWRLHEPGFAQAHTDQVWSVAFDAQGRWLASGSKDKQCAVWDLDARVLHFQGKHEDEVFAVAFMPDGKCLVSGGEDRSVCVWSVDSGSRLLRLVREGDAAGHDDRVRALVTGSDRWGPYFVSGGFDRRLIVWDAQGDRQAVVEGHAMGVMGLAVGRSGELVAAYEDGVVRTWTLPTDGDATATPVLEHERPALSVIVHPNGTDVISGGRDHQILRGPIDSPPRRADEPPVADDCIGAHDHWVWALAIDDAGERLASASEDGTVRLWDLTVARPTPVVCALAEGATCSHGDRVKTVAYIRGLSGESLFVSGGYDNFVRLWDGSSGRLRRMLPKAKDWVQSLDVHNDGGLLAAVWGAGTIRLWDLKRLLALDDEPVEPLAEWPATKSSRILCVRFLGPDRLASAGEDKLVHVWTRGPGGWNDRTEWTFAKRHEHVIRALAMLPDGRVASGDAHGLIHVWRPEESSERALTLALAKPYQGLRLRRATLDGEPIEESMKAALRQLGAQLDDESLPSAHGPKSPPPSTATSIGNLFSMLFDEHELRRFIADIATHDDIVKDLPGSGVSMSRLSQDAAGVLDRHGLLDDVFFERLLEKRPGGAKEIEKVRQAIIGRAKRDR